MPAVYVQAHLESMWTPGYENGDPLLGDAQDVELAAEWEDSGRKPGEWFEAVLECRFIDETEGGYQIHDLHDNAPEYVADRQRREIERRKPKRCRQCGEEYRSADPRSLYCTAACRQKVFRDKNRNGTVTEVSVTSNGPLRSVTDSNGTPAPAPAPAPVEEQKMSTSSVSLSATRTTTQASTNGEKKRRAKSDLDYTAEFLEFWSAYPPIRKGSKADAFRAWTGALKHATPEALIAAATEYALSARGRGPFSKMPSSWLNGRCWEDDRTFWGSSGAERPEPPPPRDPTPEELANLRF